MFDRIISSSPSCLTSIGTNEMLFDLKENFVSPRLMSLLVRLTVCLVVDRPISD